LIGQTEHTTFDHQLAPRVFQHGGSAEHFADFFDQVHPA
jgi:hypothetical protein